MDLPSSTKETVDKGDKNEKEEKESGEECSEDEEGSDQDLEGRWWLKEILLWNVGRLSSV